MGMKNFCNLLSQHSAGYSHMEAILDIPTSADAVGTEELPY